jgi:hypothetical protein
MVTKNLKIALVALLLVVFPLSIRANESGFSYGHDIGDERLRLQGTATHKVAGLIKVCRAALYVPASAAGDDIHLADIPKRIEIEYFVPVGRERLVRMAEESLQKQFTEEQLRPFSSQIERFNRMYKDVGRSDRYALTYHPERGLTLELNGEQLGTVAGAQFASTYLSIWLGEDPVSPSMKRKLLASG